MSWASVVLPVPGGPQRITDDSRSASIRVRSGRPAARRWSWPTISSSVAGRSRAASGACRARCSAAAAEKRSAMAGGYCRVPARGDAQVPRCLPRVEPAPPRTCWRSSRAAAAAVVWLIVLGGLGMFVWRRVQGVPLRGDRGKPSDADRPVPTPILAVVAPAADAPTPSGSAGRPPADLAGARRSRRCRPLRPCLADRARQPAGGIGQPGRVLRPGGGGRRPGPSRAATAAPRSARPSAAS